MLISYEGEKDFEPRGGSGEKVFLSTRVRIELEPTLIWNILYDEGKKGNQTIVQLEGIPVYFPYKPYNIQEKYMQNVIEALNGEKNALLHSPTGTGKTLSLLCSTLAWLKHHRETSRDINAERLCPTRIIYASRTHSQLKQVIGELKETVYKPTVAILASRDRTCINKELRAKNLDGPHLMQGCRAARNANKCPVYPGSLCTVGPERERHLNSFLNIVQDIEDLKIMGKEKKFCPYYHSRFQTVNLIVLEERRQNPFLQKRADIIFLPYNYIIDKRFRDVMGVQLQNSIVILDEAHNIDAIAERSASMELKLTEIQACLRELRSLKRNLDEALEQCAIDHSQIEMIEGPLKALRDNLREMLARRRYLMLKNSKTQKPVSEIHIKEGSAQELLTLFTKWTINKNSSYVEFENGITKDNYKWYLENLRACIEERSFDQPREALNSFRYALTTLFDVTDLPALMDQYIMTLRCVADKVNPSKKDLIVSLQCLSPSIRFKEIQSHNPRSIILTSGTLVPFDIFKKEIGVEFQKPLVNPYVIDPKKQLVASLITGCRDRHPLNFAFKNTKIEASDLEVGNMLIEIARIVPNGILVYFPSRDALDRCRGAWERENIIIEIEKHKLLYQEPRNKKDHERVVKSYRSDAQNHGAILLAVCRGKSSEGVNFANEDARAVIIVGTPFLNPLDKRVKAKMNKLGSLGRSWYIEQMLRATNQAVGRVIRHRNDEGIVILCDERFGEHKRYLPDWVLPVLEENRNYQEILPALIAFCAKFERTMEIESEKPKNYKHEDFKEDAFHSPKSKFSQENFEGWEDEEKLVDDLLSQLQSSQPIDRFRERAYKRQPVDPIDDELSRRIQGTQRSPTILDTTNYSITQDTVTDSNPNSAPLSFMSQDAESRDSILSFLSIQAYRNRSRATSGIVRPYYSQCIQTDKPSKP
eukprot:TRINITY_DN2311_c0_g2_i1.p1 TRINITY_DN2311_c0_g2~~TRINITY_DN2311_c0_g2_i1.p1  ORF type:complete len:931 (+),score=84.02 TRINITY_DN2311_c0_g2_i1:88-2880(+)